MGRHIDLDIFSNASLTAAIRDLKSYADGVEAACKEACYNTAVYAKAATETTYNGYGGFDVQIGSGSSDTPQYELGILDESKDGDATYRVWSNDEDALFLEFGAGVTLNGSLGSSPHPNPVGYTIGSYPGQKNAGKPYWFKPKSAGGGVTVGTQASCGMYNACEESGDQLRNNVISGVRRA